MEYQLLVVRGRSASDVLKLVDGVTTVGRHDDCQIRIKSSQVSRRHCEFFEKKGLLLVKDLGSANGTLVNGKKVDGQQVLEPGDELTIGGITLRVAKVGQTPPAKAAAPAPAAAKSPSDTAVVAAQVKSPAAAAAPAPLSDDDFEIDFDDDPSIEPEPVDFDAEGADLLAEAEGLPPGPPPKAAPADIPAAASKPAAPGGASSEPEPADEAIADFLLGIKLDEDD
jgi:predicted component of type VI protein secretion system